MLLRAAVEAREAACGEGDAVAAGYRGCQQKDAALTPVVEPFNEDSRSDGDDSGGEEGEDDGKGACAREECM